MDALQIFLVVIAGLTLIGVFLLIFILMFFNPVDEKGVSLRRWSVDRRKAELHAKGLPDDDIGK